MTKVVHCKKEHYDVYIGRPSLFGNPFEISIDGSRKDVIFKYENYLRKNEKFGKDITDNTTILEKIDELDGKILGCWCKPLSCHGDVLIKLINERKNTHEFF